MRSGGVSPISWTPCRKRTNSQERIFMDKSEILQALPSQPQRQDSLLDQLRDLYDVANRLGMYDAADLIRRLMEEANP